MVKETKKADKSLKQKDQTKKADNLSVVIFNQTGEKVKSKKLSEEVFGLKPNPELIALAIRVYLANQKQSIASTKTRSEVRGGGRKPWRQKGTGRARAGSIRAGGRVGGGVIFGPRPHKQELTLPKKTKLKALAVALSDRVREKGLVLVDKLSFKEPKTKKANQLVSKINTDSKKTLVVLEESKPAVIKSFNNLEHVGTTQAMDLNTLDVVKFPRLIITLEALEKLEKRLVGKNE